MVAIVGVGRTRETLALVANQPQPVKKLPLSLSFDHRAVTGGEAARFLTAMIKNLQG
jgi:pyruvate dehydrogenase E2 component (dihydrolipoamide acetyltransferase)